MDSPVPGFDDLALHRDLGANLTGFCRLLRRHGGGIGPGEQGEALKALELIELSDARAFRAALRTTLAKSLREQKTFDHYFDHYWMVWDRGPQLNRQTKEREAPEPQENANKSRADKPAAVTIGNWLKSNQAVEEEEVAGYSPFEVFTRRDFKGFSPEDLHEIIELISELSKALATRFSRRYQQTRRRGRLDLRRTLRLSLRRGGDMVDLACRCRRRQRLKLVLLCDVSKSMDLYSRFLIQFIYAFQRVYRRIETFAFSTSLHRITPILKTDNLSAALGELSGAVPDWSGGTKIGRSLHTFLEGYGGLVDRNTVVLIMSDGWDTGEIELLEDSLDQIRRRARCLIWLNPLMGSPTYQPSCRGMQAALPFIDILAAAHNLDSLRQLVRQLGKIQRGAVKPGVGLLGKSLQADSPTWAGPEPPTTTGEKVDRQAWLKRFGKAP